jgi:hypothetical protein
LLSVGRLRLRGALKMLAQAKEPGRGGLRTFGSRRFRCGERARRTGGLIRNLRMLVGRAPDNTDVNPLALAGRCSFLDHSALPLPSTRAAYALTMS